jgi:glutathione S-transferase
MNRTLDVVTSWTASVLRGTSGLSVGPLGPRPAQTLRLYEFENCPFCRLVREALTMLDLEADVLPCPPGGERFRPEAERLGGKQQFPYLVDPNTGTSLYESGEIIAYLYRTYGSGSPPLSLRLRPLALPTSSLTSALRAPTARATPSTAPARPLELWSFEASPYCRIVREALCRLELPYRLHNVAKRSPSRAAFRARPDFVKMMVPFLHDPNTGKSLYESADIVRYLDETYGAR